MLELESIVAAAGLPDPGKNTWDYGLGNDIASDSRQSSQSSSVGKQPEDTNVTEATQYLKDLGLHLEGQPAMIGDISGGMEHSSHHKYRQGSNTPSYGRNEPQIYGRGNIPRIQLSQPTSHFSMTPEAHHTPRFQYPFPPRDSPRWQNQNLHTTSHTSISPTDVRSNAQTEFPFPEQYVPPPQQNAVQLNTSLQIPPQQSHVQQTHLQQDPNMYATPQISMSSLGAQAVSQPEYSFPQQYPTQQNPFDFPGPPSYQDIAAANFNPAGTTNMNSQEYSFLNIGLPNTTRTSENLSLPTATVGPEEDFDLNRFMQAGGFGQQNQEQNQDENQKRM